ncbi:iron-sulfur cluster assembly scaffold protein [Candidatus Poribacteria bacterium]|nr:iron-sulfur cluster assembly scaffold protein [Candidatus Poribacteria bacterium]MYK20541.1 iron-sulfur cluster assembly scaffold protein [Candidatus Poribacteria bacterium]
MYTPQVIEHYENPRNVGTITDADGAATVGSPANGEMLKLTLKVANNVIVAAKFRAFGCPTAIASTSVLTEMVMGSKVSEALQITAIQISEALGGLPEDKQRYAGAAEEVLKTAIADFMSKTEV